MLALLRPRKRKVDITASRMNDAKVDPITERIMGSMEQQSDATVQRGKLRTILGDELIRELVLK